MRRLGDLLVCGACLRLRWSLTHLAARAVGFCPGDR